jgi:hypothetical protein
MPRFIVNAEINMFAEITPEGSFRGIDGLEDNSSFYNSEAQSFTGEVTFEIDADDDDNAYDVAQETLENNLSFNDYNGIEWTFDEIMVTHVEQITPPMDIDLALATIAEYLRQRSVTLQTPLTVLDAEALQFLFDWAIHQLHLSRQNAVATEPVVPGPLGIVGTS